MKDPTERLAVNSVRGNELKQRDQKVNQIIKAGTKPLLDDDDLIEYTKNYAGYDPRYSRGAVNSDLRYVQKKRAEIALLNQNTRLPHAVEYLAMGWLDSDMMFDPESMDGKNPPATRTHDYDDFANGADVTKTILLSGEDAEECGTDHLTMAFDVTISGRPDTIRKKLRPFDNGLPYGFTKIKYYSEKKGDTIRIHSDKDLVPRFVIGVDAQNVELTIKNGIPRNFAEFGKEESDNAVLTRFKILAEMKAEINLFLSKIPEDDDPVNQAAIARLYHISELIEPMLNRCAKMMTPQLISEGNGTFGAVYDEPKHPVFSRQDSDALKKTKSDVAATKLITSYLCDSNHPKYDATFATIMGYTQNPEQ